MRCISLALQRLEIDTDRAAAGQSGPPRYLLSDAALKKLRLIVGQHVCGFGNHLHLDATAGHRPLELTIRRNDQLAANGYRRRAPGGDDRR